MPATTLADLAPDQWLYAMYAADATLTALIAGRIYQDVAPQDVNGSIPAAAFPCIIIRPYVFDDTGTVDSTIFMLSPEYIVTAVGRTTHIRDIEPIAARIHELTHRAAVTTVSRGTIHSAVRRRLHRQAYRDGAVEYRELGGIYKIYSQA